MYTHKILTPSLYIVYSGGYGARSNSAPTIGKVRRGEINASHTHEITRGWQKAGWLHLNGGNNVDFNWIISRRVCKVCAVVLGWWSFSLWYCLMGSLYCGFRGHSFHCKRVKRFGRILLKKRTSRAFEFPFLISLSITCTIMRCYD